MCSLNEEHQGHRYVIENDSAGATDEQRLLLARARTIREPEGWIGRNVQRSYQLAIHNMLFHSSTASSH